MSVLEAAPDTVLDRTRSAGRSARLVIVGASATAIHTPLMEYAVATVYTTVHVRHGAERQAALGQKRATCKRSSGNRGKKRAHSGKSTLSLAEKHPFSKTALRGAAGAAG